MARKPSVRYWASRKGFCCWIDGVQHKLAEGPDDSPNGPTYLAALTKFTELLTLKNAPAAGDANTVKTIAELYGQHLEAQGRAKSFKLFMETMPSGVERFGSVPVRDLKPHHIQAWLGEMGKPRALGKRTVRWAATTQRMAYTNFRTALNWAVRQGFIETHCLQAKGAVDLPSAKPRGRECYLEPAETASLQEKAPRRLAPLLAILSGTGCRPAEAYHMEARHYRQEGGCFVFPWNPPEGEWTHKTAKKTQRDRVVFVPPELTGLVESLIAESPTGPILRNHRGKRWNDKTVSQALGRLAEKAGITKPVMAYSYRHTFATRFLLNGGSIKLLATVLGTSVGMLERHYSHIDVERGILAQTLWKIMGS